MFTLTAENAAEYAAGRGLVREARRVRVEELPGGVSCTTLRLHPQGADPVVIKQALAKLRVAADWRSDPARSRHEVLAIRFASHVLGPENVPHILDEDEPNHIFAMPSAALDAENWKQQMLAGHVSDDLARECADILGTVQGVAADAEILPQELRDKTFFRQLRLEAYFEASARAEPDVAAELHELVETMENAAFCFTHADYTPKNFLVSDGHLFLLDYEVAHIGHFAFDPASILNHLYLKSRKLPDLAPEFQRASQVFLGRYCELRHLPENEPILWRTLGALMLARVRGKSPVEYLAPPADVEIVETAKALLTGDIWSLDDVYR
jgi:5-methylthioribose kinase